MRLPVQELRELARLRNRARPVGVAPLVAVEKAGRARDAVGVDGGERGDHCRDRDTPGVDIAKGVERAARTFVPGGRGVVFEAKWCRHEEVVRDAGAGRDVAVGVDRDRLYRRGSDVDSDGELGHGGRH